MSDKKDSGPPPKKQKVGRFTPGAMQHIFLMEHMDKTLRPTDVVFNTLPKCGQTMTQALLLALKKNGDTENCGKLLEESPWIENNYPRVDRETGKSYFASEEEAFKLRDECPDPRVFKQHVVWNEVAQSPDPEIQKKVKYLTITRDLRDLPWSFFSHTQALSDEYNELYKKHHGMPPPGNDFNAFFDMWLKPEVPFSPFRFLKEMWKHKDDENLLMLKYEDVVKDKKGAALQLCDFLGWKRPDDKTLEEKILPFCSLEYMKKHQYTKFLEPTHFNRGDFVRGGGCSNRKKLTDDQLARLQKAMKENLPADLIEYLNRK